MKESALRLGFVFSHTGCPCEGSPLHYKKTTNGIMYRLILYTGRKVWRLKKGGDLITSGKAEELETKLQQYGII